MKPTLSVSEKMHIKVKYLGLIRSKIGKKGEEFQVKEGAFLSELLNKLAETYGEPLKDLFDVRAENILDPTFIVTVNGISHTEDARLSEGDTVALMTLISGG